MILVCGGRLRENTALKTLCIDFGDNETESHATAIRMEVLAALRENESLETLYLSSKDAGFECYLFFIAALKLNTTLKRLRLHLRDTPHPFHHMDEDKNEAKSFMG